MSTRLTLPQRRAQETRRRILDAAYTVFTRNGYGESSVDAVIAEAGISKGALYHHFVSKESLLRVLLQDRIRR